MSNIGPDFICIGAQKAGTGWLYEQLRAHPDFWVPPIKELHYFDRLARSDDPNAGRSLPSARTDEERIMIGRDRARNPIDDDFLSRFENLSERQSLDLDAYGRLFSIKQDRIAGDITPGYSTLDDAMIEKIVTGFPATKIIFMARDPVERAWSQLSMYVRRGLIRRFDSADVEQISSHLRRPEIVSRSFPSRIVGRWRRHVAADLFRVFFFDDLTIDAAGLRQSIITFLGGDPAKQSGSLPADYNAKAAKPKLPMNQSASRLVAEFFKTELRACATELGGPAAHWPDRYGF